MEFRGDCEIRAFYKDDDPRFGKDGDGRDGRSLEKMLGMEWLPEMNRATTDWNYARLALAELGGWWFA